MIMMMMMMMMMTITTTTTTTSMWNVKTRVDTSNNRSDWDHFKDIQKMREQYTRKP
jgi:hypothetical protein